MAAGEESVEVLVLMDGDRNYYLVPRAVLERGRAGEEQSSALERAIGGDVHGYLLGAARSRRDAASTIRANARFAPVGVLRLSADAVTGLISRSQAPRSQAGESPPARGATLKDTTEGERS